MPEPSNTSAAVATLTLTFQRTDDVNEYGRRRCTASVGDDVVATLWLADDESDGRVVQQLLRQFGTGFAR